MRALGFVLCLAGGLLLAPQLVAERPWQAAVALGFGLIVGGGLLLADNPRRRQQRLVRRHRRGRRGYIVGDGR